MKKLLFATAFASIALASSMGCNTDTLTGLHFGLGVSVLFDKYEADADVATISNEGTKALSYVDVKSGTAANLDTNTPVQNLATFWSSPTTTSTNVSDTTLGEAKTIFSGAAGLQKIAINTAYVKRDTFKKRTTNCGGEVKLAYFHDFGNHLMIGVDLTGIIASKNKKTVKIEPTAIADAATDTGLRVLYNGTSIIEDNKFTETGKTLIATGIEGDPTANQIADNTKLKVDNLLAVKAANPGFHTIMDAAQLNDLPGNFALKTQTGSEAELTFEKSVFNPRLAFIVGGTVYGWFAGLRLGMSYTTRGSWIKLKQVVL